MIGEGYASVMERRIDSLLIGLAACLCTTVKEAAASTDIPAPCFCGVLPGNAIAFDYCDDSTCEDPSGATSGMAWTRLVGVSPIVDQTGAPISDCVSQLQITVEAGMLRPAPVFSGEDGEAPTAQQQLASSMLQFADMGLIHKAITCCEIDDDTYFDFRLGEYTPLGPEGGCVGGIWTAAWTVDFGS